MSSYFLKTALRNLSKNKLTTAINLTGLIIGMSTSLLMSQYILFEFSYDDFHQNADNIYRVTTEHYSEGALDFSRALTYREAGPAMKDNFPEVREFVRLLSEGGRSILLSHNSQESGSPTESVQFYETEFLTVDPAFFRVFSVPLLRGNPHEALAGTNKIVMSASAARKYFGEADPLGKTVSVRKSMSDEGTVCTVSGIFDDLPTNSHIDFKFLFPIAGRDYDLNWAGAGNTACYTYILLSDKADAQALEAKFPAWIKAHSREGINPETQYDILKLQPLRDIHLYSNLEFELRENGSATIVFSLMLGLGLVLATAWFNYINLATAQGSRRAKEVGIKKAIGSNRQTLIVQFLLESFMLNLIAAVGTLLVCEFGVSFFKEFLELDLPGIWDNASLLFILLAMFCGGALFSGSYPAFVLSSFNPIEALTGRKVQKSTGVQMKITRGGLLILQFAISIFLLFVTFVIFEQLDFMRSKKLGVNIDQTLVLTAPNVTGDSYFSDLESFKTELQKNSAFANITASSEIPGKPYSATRMIMKVGQDRSQARPFHAAWVDDDFFPSFGVKLLAGRNFSEDGGTDDQAIIVNKSLAQKLGYKPDDAIQKQVYVQKAGVCSIIGVIEDYHHLSPEHPYRPSIFLLNTERNKKFISVSLKITWATHDRIKSSIAVLEHNWKTFFPGNPFAYFFLDEAFNQQYRADTLYGKILSLFALVAIVIANIGLLGMMSFSINGRDKEIGIRKVLGASVFGIVRLLSGDFTKLVLVAIVITLPVSYFIAQSWLEGFAYRIELQPWYFVGAGLLALLTAWVTVGTLAVRAATVNPVQCLRDE